MPPPPPPSARLLSPAPPRAAAAPPAAHAAAHTAAHAAPPPPPPVFGSKTPSAALKALRAERAWIQAELQGLEDRLDVAMDEAELGGEAVVLALAPQLRALRALMRVPAWRQAGEGLCE
jgi:hypothetical protein